MSKFNALYCTLMLACAAHVWAEAPAANVRVEFVQPEKFTDVNERLTRTAPEKNHHLYTLRTHVEKRATRYLHEGQQLEIRFTDIDLAGDHLPQVDPALSDVRVVTRLYPPRLKFSYSLRDASGTLLKSGDADLRDLAFDTQTGTPYTDALRYEKRMLDKWMRKELGG